MAIPPTDKSVGFLATRFVNRMQKICKEKGLDFVVVKSKFGSLYNYYFNKKKVMSMMMRDCTSKFKVAWEQQTLNGYSESEETCKNIVGGCFL